MLAQGYDEPLFRSIVSGPLDADKQDYLLRDSYFCGVKYGVFDLQQLHRELVVVLDPADGRKQLMVSADGVHALEQFVLAKYYLTAQVYSHRVRLVTDQMVVRAITLGIEEDKIPLLRELYSYDGEARFVENYTKWDDARFLLEFGDERYRGGYCHDLVERLRQRRLLKRIFDERVSHLPEACRERITSISKTENRELRRELESRVAASLQAAGVTLDSALKDTSNLVIVHSYSLKSARAQSRNDEGSIMVHTAPNPTPFEEESDLFKSINEKLNDPHFSVYAPIAYNSPGKRREMMSRIKELILRCLEDSLRSDLGYEAHYYGPYSEGVATANLEMRSLGYLSESVAGWGRDQRGFEMSRYDYTLTEAGARVADRKAALNPELWKRIEASAKVVTEAGNLDYMELSIAAKAYYILTQLKHKATLEDLANMLPKLGWKVSFEELQKATEFLQKANLVTQGATA